MIIVSHREIDKGYLESMVQPHLHIARPYADSDLVLIRNKDYTISEEDRYTLSLGLHEFIESLKHIYQDAYRQGREEAINQMMHP